MYLTSDHQFHQQIAADSTGYAYQGNTRTFYPKVGDPLNELYADFNTGCYPTLASHSITVESESDKTAPKKNVFTFTYAYATSISYTVEYRYADNNELISSAPGRGRVTNFSNKAVVTERFAVIQEYIPDAFYKRLILAVKVEANGTVTSQDNVVVFYYTKNNTHAPYAVHHMLQTLDAALKDQSGLETDANGNYKYYAEDEARIQGIGKTGNTLHVTPQTFSGFTVSKKGIQITTEITTAGTTTTKTEIPLNVTDFAITIDKNGTDLYVFYTRSDQNYRVYYLKYGTPTTDLNNLVYDADDPAHTSGVLAAVKPDSGKFGQTVTENALEIAGWSCVSDKQQTLLLRSNDTQNNIFFFYRPVQYNVDYLVWPQGGGTVSPSKEVVEGDTPFEGSTPTEKPGYRFDGWYLNENCTKPVTVVEGTVDSTTNRLVPNKSELEAMPKVNTFYAKFVPVLGDLTITRSHASNEGKGDRVFVYRIKAAEDPSFELFVSIKGSDSVTIKNLFCFTYTIEQQNGWSWRYADTSQTVKVTEGGSAEVTFGSPPATNKWLNGSSEREVNRKR
ncbi:MAG: InlB B-repeat-containing protein [Oscillospiraceae bacterium]